MPASPTPADRPADQLCAAAEKLRAAAMGSPMNSSPWRYAKGLPSDSVRTEVGWEVVYGDAPGDLRYIALMHPGVGLALAALLEAVAVDAIRCRCVPECPTGAALAVARQLLGTSVTQGAADKEPTESARLFTLHLDASDGTCVAAHGIVWPDGAVTLHRRNAWQMPPGTGRSMDEALAAFCGPHRSQYRVEWATPAAPPAPADRATVLREAADFVGNDDTCDCGGCDTCVPNKLADGLRALADDAAAGVQPPTTTADRAAALGMTPTEYRQHSHTTAVQQVQAAAQGLFAGTGQRVMDALKEPTTPPAAPAAPEETTPAPQCSAALLPATDEAVDRCVRHGAHDTHVTAAGVRWPNDEDPEL